MSALGRKQQFVQRGARDSREIATHIEVKDGNEFRR